MNDTPNPSGEWETALPNLPWAENNPQNEPAGDFTGRCGKCGSKDLWDDNLVYGCNNCGHTRA